MRWGLLALVALAAANTETYMFSVPNYYNIPFHSSSPGKPELARINETTWVLQEHPIFSIYNYHHEQAIVSVPYDFGTKPHQRLLVRVNNYQNEAFASNDIINVKLCWPATSPIDFHISHRFIRQQEFGSEPVKDDPLHIYVVVDFVGHFYSVSDKLDTSFDMFLAISRLPSKIPIPIELYNYVLYLVDLIILTWWVLPHITSIVMK